MQSKQSQVWLLAALAAPIAHFSGCGWLTVLLTAALVLPLAILEKDWSFPRPVAFVQILWLGIVAGSLLPGAAACWPSDNSLAVPLTLLTLAALTGAAKAPRVAVVDAICMGSHAGAGVPAGVSSCGGEGKGNMVYGGSGGGGRGIGTGRAVAVCSGIVAGSGISDSPGTGVSGTCGRCGADHGVVHNGVRALCLCGRYRPKERDFAKVVICPCVGDRVAFDRF